MRRDVVVRDGADDPVLVLLPDVHQHVRVRVLGVLEGGRVVEARVKRGLIFASELLLSRLALSLFRHSLVVELVPLPLQIGPASFVVQRGCRQLERSEGSRWGGANGCVLRTFTISSR
eukprot:477053-Pyramimonas_sp.AAC.1